jgi:hypothetical protein
LENIFLTFLTFFLYSTNIKYLNKSCKIIHVRTTHKSCSLDTGSRLHIFILLLKMYVVLPVHHTDITRVHPGTRVAFSILDFSMYVHCWCIHTCGTHVHTYIHTCMCTNTNLYDVFLCTHSYLLSQYVQNYYVSFILYPHHSRLVHVLVVP